MCCRPWCSWSLHSGEYSYSRDCWKSEKWRRDWTYLGERAGVGVGGEGEGVAGLGGGASDPTLPHVLHRQVRPHQAQPRLGRNILGNVEVGAGGTGATAIWISNILPWILPSLSSQLTPRQRHQNKTEKCPHHTTVVSTGILSSKYLNLRQAVIFKKLIIVKWVLHIIVIMYTFLYTLLTLINLMINSH